MSPYPSFIQSIPDSLRRLRVQKLWLLAQYMTGAEKDVSRQIGVIDEQIGRFEQRSRLIEEFWEIENREDDKPDAANDNHFESVKSAQSGMNRNRMMIKKGHEEVFLGPRSPTPSKLPTVRQSSLRAPLETCKIATTTTVRAATETNREREIVSSSQYLSSNLIASTHAAGSKIGRINFLR